MLARIEEERDGEPGLLGELGGHEGRAVVAGDLVLAHALRGGAVEILDDERGNALQPILVVRADGHDHDEEIVFIGGGDADLRAGADEKRTDVHGAAGFAGRDVVDVVEHDAVDGFEVHFLGDLGVEQLVSGAVHALDVFPGTEDADLSVLAAEGLHAFEAGLAVVETGGRDAHGDGGISSEFAFVPCAVFPVEGDVGAGGHETERESRPVDVGADGTGIVHKKLHLLNCMAAGKSRQNEMNIKKFTRFSAIVNVFFRNRIDFFRFWANLMDVMLCQ